MTKEKSKSKKSVEKTPRKKVDSSSAASSAVRTEVVAETPKKSSLLPSCISKPLDELKARLAALEKIVEELVSSK